MADKFNDLHKTADGNTPLRDAVTAAANAASAAQNTANIAKTTIDGLTEYIKINDNEEYESLELSEVTQIYASKQDSTQSKIHHIAMGVDTEENDKRWISVINADTIYISSDSQKTTLKTGNDLDKLVLSSGVKLDENVQISNTHIGAGKTEELPLIGIDYYKAWDSAEMTWEDAELKTCYLSALNSSTTNEIMWNYFGDIVKYLYQYKDTTSMTIYKEFNIPFNILIEYITQTFDPDSQKYDTSVGYFHQVNIDMQLEYKGERDTNYATYKDPIKNPRPDFTPSSIKWTGIAKGITNVFSPISSSNAVNIYTASWARHEISLVIDSVNYDTSTKIYSYTIRIAVTPYDYSYRTINSNPKVSTGTCAMRSNSVYNWVECTSPVQE